VKGFIEVVDELEHVQDKVYDRPTILVSGRVKGEEEIPDGAVAVLTPDMPDVLSHVSVRARNGKVWINQQQTRLFGSCHSVLQEYIQLEFERIENIIALLYLNW